MQNRRIGIKACGYSVPPHIRRNDDPIFKTITKAMNAQGIAEVDLFTGLKERRYLEGNEQLEMYMAEAATVALERAQVKGEDIDRLYGYTSVSEYLSPNSLYYVHQKLQLSEQTLVVPINNEFSTFLSGTLQACEAIATGHSQHALVVCGTNWTHYMDYTQGHSLSIGDGAGAAVIGPDADFELIDYATQTVSEQYGAMTMQTREASHHPTYKITEDAGVHSFQVTAMDGVPDMVLGLLKKHGITGKHIALITHQASRVLMDHWATQIKPKQYLDTLEQFGNLTLASYPVTLAYSYPMMTAPYLVLAAVGIGYHQTALLFKHHFH